jgi:uncharacterized protein (DUF58 family)
VTEPLLDDEFLRKLERLSLFSRRIRAGTLRGEKVTRNRGVSLEFADYRLYQPGDDFRYLDWNIYSRLGRLFVKVFTAEENLTVHILIDTSRSMAFGNPSKLWYAGRLAAALGYLAICHLDRVGVSAFAEGIAKSLPPGRQRPHVFALFEYIAALEPAGRTDFNRTLRDYSLGARRPGLAILLTDLLDPSGYVEGLRALLYRRFEIMLIHIVTDEEISPDFRGPYRLVDGETGEAAELNVGTDTIGEYQERLTRFLSETEAYCRRHHIEYLRTRTSVPFQDVVLRYLREGVFVR